MVLPLLSKSFGDHEQGLWNPAGALWPADCLARLGGGVGRFFWLAAEEAGPVPWAVLRSRPRSLAAAVERFQRRVQRLWGCTAGSCCLEFKVKGGREEDLYSFEMQYQSFLVLGSFRADTVPDVAMVILGGMPPIFTSDLFWSIDHASH